jgi:nitrous-oxide reductase
MALLNTSFGEIPWDDTHHPSLSQTGGMHDGRWLFINANNTPRFARIDLTKFETIETIEVPNTGGNHGAPFVTENTEYVIGATRFSVPIPQADVSIGDFATKFKGTISFVKANEAGKMDIAFQLLVPGFNYDLGRPGKGPSHGWAFFTSYNTEQAYTRLEVNASKNDYDYIAEAFTTSGSSDPGSGSLSGGVARALDHARSDGPAPPLSRMVHTEASHFVDSRNATRTAANSFIAEAA